MKKIFAFFAIVVITGISLAPVAFATFKRTDQSPFSTAEGVCKGYDTDFSKDYDSGNYDLYGYNDGFDFGCNNAVEDHFSDKTMAGNCTAAKVPPDTIDASMWIDGCTEGYGHALEILARTAEEQNLISGGNAPGQYCAGITNELFVGLPSEKPDFELGCKIGFYARTTDIDEGAIIACGGLSGKKKEGCEQSYQQAQIIIAAFSSPTSAEHAKADANGCTDKLHAAGVIDGSLTGIKSYAFLRGCNAGFDNGKAGLDPSSCPSYFLISGASETAVFNASFKNGCDQGILTGIAAQGDPGEYDPDDPSSGVVPTCDPTLLPGEVGACGVSAAQQLIKNIIKFLFWIVIPIAAIMIGFGGFTIMTALGSPEKVKKGTSMITIALTGIAIMAVSYLLVQFIFTALNLTGVNFQ